MATRTDRHEHEDWWRMFHWVVGLLVCGACASLMASTISDAGKRSRRVNCGGGPRQIGLALLMYSGDNAGYFAPRSEPCCNLEPLNTANVMDDAKVWAVPNADTILTLPASYPGYIYRGSGLLDDGDRPPIESESEQNRPDN